MYNIYYRFQLKEFVLLHYATQRNPFSDEEKQIFKLEIVIHVI